MIAADLDGDGDLDVVVPALFADIVAVALNNGDGRFAAATQYTTAKRPVDAAVADVTGDGVLDVIVRSVASCEVFGGLGDGTLASPTTILDEDENDGVGLAVGDVDGDGDVDVVAARVDGSSSLLINTSGAFAPPVELPGPTPSTAFTRDATLADLDGDGALELILANEAPGPNMPPVFQLAVWAGLGDGAFGVPTGFGLAGYKHSRVLAADVDADGDLDVVVSGQERRIDVLRNTTVR